MDCYLISLLTLTGANILLIWLLAVSQDRCYRVDDDNERLLERIQILEHDKHMMQDMLTHCEGDKTALREKIRQLSSQLETLLKHRGLNNE